MKRQQKKAFTLVELLVVIAILAILASVAVVGYTSFMKNAALSNDDSTVTQLNRYFEAMKADSTSSYSKDDFDVTPKNAWAVIDAILKESGIGELEPDALKYGYHIWFNTDTDKFEVVELDDNGNVLRGAVRALLNFPAKSSNTGNIPGLFNDSQNTNYFLADTKGSALAETVRGFYTFDIEFEEIDTTGKTDTEIEAAYTAAMEAYRVKAEEKYNALLDNADKVADENNIQNYKVWLENAALKINYFTFQNGNTTPTNMPFEHHNVTKHTDQKVIVDKSSPEPTTTVVSTANSPIAAPTTDVEVKVSVTESTQLSSNSFNITVPAGVKVTIEIDTKDVEAAKEVLDANFTNENVIIKINGVEYTLAEENELYNKTEYDDYKAKVEAGETVSKPETVTTLNYQNPLKSFDIVLVGTDLSANNKIVDADSTDNSLTMVWDAAEFSFEGANFKGVQLTNNVISNTELEWAVHRDYTDYLTYDSETGKFSFTNEWPADGLVKVTATAKVGDANGNYATTDFTINLAKVDAATVTLANRDFAMSSTTNKITFVYDSESGDNEYSIAIKGDVTPNKIGAGLTYDTTFTSTVALGGSGLTIDGSTVRVTGEGSGTISLQIGKYLTSTIAYEVFDASNFYVKPIHNDIYVGNGNTIKVSDLFTGTIPSGAELRIYNEPAQNDTFMNPNRTLVPLKADIGTNGVTMGVDDNTIEGVTLESEIQFVGTRTSQVYLAFFANGTRVSNDLRVTVLDAMNVTDYAGLVANTTSNKVLLKDVIMAANDSLVLLDNATLYGNGHTIDVRNYDETRTGEEAIITLTKAVLKNVNVVGEVYKSTELVYQNPTSSARGASLVKATDGSTINGCYLANTRSPLITTGAVTVENSTIFGGNYANIDVRNGTLTLKGNVVTINQITSETPDTVGFGIAVDLFAPAETKVDISGATLKQFNYIKQADASKLPSITMDLTIEDVTVVVGSEINTFFGDEATYGNYLYTDTTNSNTKLYLSSSAEEGSAR